MAQHQDLCLQRDPRLENPTSAHQISLQNSTIGRTIHPIRRLQPTGLGFRQGQRAIHFGTHRASGRGAKRWVLIQKCCDDLSEATCIYFFQANKWVRVRMLKNRFSLEIKSIHDVPFVEDGES